MPQLRVASFSLSIDGFGAGPDQDLENPMGIGGMALHEWVLQTRTFQRMSGKDGGTTGTDDDFAARGFRNIGAWILGRNMFGPVRGPWPDDDWRGWWGDEPPYHTPVFVLTHHARAPLVMKGGTTFHFVTDGIHAALERAKEAARRQGRALGRRRGHDSPVPPRRPHRRASPRHLAGPARAEGEHLFGDIDMPALGYICAEQVSSPNATHLVLKKVR